MILKRLVETNKPLRVGLVGAGYVSSHHLRALKSIKDVEVVGIADSNFKRAQQVALKFDVPKVCQSLAEMTSLRPEVIHILTPPASHCGLTLEALDMGCHVLVEKPMAQTPEECDRMIARAKAAKRVLSVNHSARMDPVIQRALGLVKKGVCGDILSISYFRSSDYPPYMGGPLPPPYREGAYPFNDLGVHGLCLIEAFLGKIKSVDVHYSSSGRDPNLLFDQWRAVAECQNGSGHFYLCWTARPILNELVVYGTHGIMSIDCFLQTCTVRKKAVASRFGELVLSTMGSAAHVLYKTPWNVMRYATGNLTSSPAIHASVRAFYAALLNGSAAPVDAEEGRRIVVWMDGVSRRSNDERDQRMGVRESIPPARVLVTGATGMVGRALTKRLLSRGEKLRVLVRRRNDGLDQEPLIHQVLGDLGDPETVDRAVRGVEVVYHVGAAMGGGSADFLRGTVCGTSNIISACLRHGVRRLVYVSSLSVLDHAGHRPGQIVTEDSLLEPHAEQRGLYTQSKLEAEKLVIESIRACQLPAVILRPGQIFGPGAQTIPPSGMIRAAGHWLAVASSNSQLPLVYVDDVVDALLAAADRDNPVGSILHLVDPELVTQRDYIEQCRRVTGNPIRVARIPKLVLYGIAFLAELLCGIARRAAPLSRYRLRSAQPLAPCDCSAAKEKLGWIPRVGAREGLRRVFGGEQAAESLIPEPVAELTTGG